MLIIMKLHLNIFNLGRNSTRERERDRDRQKRETEKETEKPRRTDTEYLHVTGATLPVLRRVYPTQAESV